jgi:hypothetical protein
MAKKEKTTRMDQYRQALAEYGKAIEDCKILAFAFESEYQCDIFHYELMYPLRPVYHLFDAMGKKAIVICPKDAENERLLVSLAESCGGERTIPNLR